MSLGGFGGLGKRRGMLRMTVGRDRHKRWVITGLVEV